MLSQARSCSPEAVKEIAIQLLEILVYLQERIPPVIHRDIKPENIIVDDKLRVYLIDFGFARVGTNTIAISSVNAGTFGFMAPEQIRNLKLTKSSDLYSLGLTLICLVGDIPSQEIGDYIDWNNQLNRKKIAARLQGCHPRFIGWLQKMTEADPAKRYSDAKAALRALKPLAVKVGHKFLWLETLLGRRQKDLDYFYEGKAKYQEGDYGGAIASYTQALQFNPNCATTYYNRGIAQSALGNYQVAILDYNTALNINPALAEAYNNRGVANFRLGNYREAIADYTRVIQLNPQSLEAYNNRALANFTVIIRGLSVTTQKS